MTQHLSPLLHLPITSYLGQTLEVSKTWIALESTYIPTFKNLTSLQEIIHRYTKESLKYYLPPSQ